MEATLLRVLTRLVSVMHIAYPRLLDLAILACRQQLLALRRTAVIEATLVAGRICWGSVHGSCWRRRTPSAEKHSSGGYLGRSNYPRNGSWRLRTDAGSWLHVSCGIQIHSSNRPQRGAQDAFSNVWHHGFQPVVSNVLRDLDARLYDIRFLTNTMPQ
jgi:hypothetical protein